MSFYKLSKVFLPLSGLLVLGSLVLLVYPGPRLSIEFTGGTLMELKLPEGKTKDDLTMALRSENTARGPLAGVTVATTKTGTEFVRTETLTKEEHDQLIANLDAKLGKTTELQFTTIGPTVGASLKRRALWALGFAGVAIIVFVAIAFRSVPRGLSPWAFGVSAIVALIHDIAITVGIFTILSYTTTFQLDTLFISALLSIMGYSVSDTIVIFDRIRDNLKEGGQREDFAQLADRSLKQTLSRTMNTGLGALIMLCALFFFGAESIRWFMLALIIGTVIGTYSSFFIATPLVVFWQKRRRA